MSDEYILFAKCGQSGILVYVFESLKKFAFLVFVVRSFLLLLFVHLKGCVSDEFMFFGKSEQFATLIYVVENLKNFEFGF